MNQPKPPFPVDLGCEYNDAHWNIATEMEREGNTLEGNPDKWVVSGHLRPPPLFRSIGLTGLQANLPAHRRLRSVLHRMRAVLPADASVDSSWPQAPCSNFNILTVGALKGRERTLSKDLDTRCNNTLPEIAPAKLSPSWTRQKSQADKGVHSFLKPDNSVKSLHRQQHTWHNSPSKAHITCRKAIVSPLTQGNVCPPGTAATSGQLMEKRQKRWRRKLEDSGALNQTEPTLLSEEGGEDNLCQWFHNLGVSDEKNDTHPLTNRSPKQGGGSSRKRHGVETESGGTVTCHVRQDRRPHFLPPIMQSDCRLHVPLVLPENSPPPSPTCSSNTPFLPLHVPSLPHHLPQVHKATSLREYKVKFT